MYLCSCDISSVPHYSLCRCDTQPMIWRVYCSTTWMNCCSSFAPIRFVSQKSKLVYSMWKHSQLKPNGESWFYYYIFVTSTYNKVIVFFSLSILYCAVMAIYMTPWRTPPALKSKRSHTPTCRFTRRVSGRIYMSLLISSKQYFIYFHNFYSFTHTPPGRPPSHSYTIAAT